MGEEVFHLQNPDKLELNNAYRSMGRYEEINIFVTLDNLVQTLQEMEATGFVGMKVNYLNSTSLSASIIAYKAKAGPCYETGRSVVYYGAALAVLDDDNHLLFAGQKTPVCEKTANVYEMPVYDKLVSCSDPDPVLIKELHEQPLPFDCNTFESDNEKLFREVKETDEAEKLVNMFYPGPFRLLILDDGRIVHRGESVAVPESETDMLVEKDGLFRSSLGFIREPKGFKEIYRLDGARCLLENRPVFKISSKEVSTNLNALDKISENLKDQLLKLIKENKKYFILTGSDKDDKLGCCPSEIVSEANGLTRSGILGSFRQAVPEESCPVTIYAYKNEIDVIDFKPQFRIDSSFRKIIKDKLQKKSGNKFESFSKWILLSFITVSLILGYFKLHDSTDSFTLKSLFEQLAPDTENQKMIILFHFTERCNLCLNMEKFINDILNYNYLQQVEDRDLRFVLMTIDDPANKNLVERFEITSATIVLVKFENKEEKNVIVLGNIWEYSQDEPVFKEKLIKELEQFLSD
jgi:hypothetical protein